MRLLKRGTTGGLRHVVYISAMIIFFTIIIFIIVKNIFLSTAVK